MHKGLVGTTSVAMVLLAAIVYFVLRPTFGSGTLLLGVLPSLVWSFGLAFLVSLLWSTQKESSKLAAFLLLLVAPTLSEGLQMLVGVGGTPDTYDAIAGTLIVPLGWFWGYKCTYRETFDCS